MQRYLHVDQQTLTVINNASKLFAIKKTNKKQLSFTELFYYLILLSTNSLVL